MSASYADRVPSFIGLWYLKTMRLKMRLSSHHKQLPMITNWPTGSMIPLNYMDHESEMRCNFGQEDRWGQNLWMCTIATQATDTNFTTITTTITIQIKLKNVLAILTNGAISIDDTFIPMNNASLNNEYSLNPSPSTTTNILVDQSSSQPQCLPVFNFNSHSILEYSVASTKSSNSKEPTKAQVPLQSTSFPVHPETWMLYPGNTIPFSRWRYVESFTFSHIQ